MPDEHQDPLTNITRYRYDGRSRVVRVRNGDGSTRVTTFDAAGNVIPDPGPSGPESEPPDEPFITGS
jgi:YD repeat-containing protein